MATAGLVTAAESENNCGHWHVTVAIDATALTLALDPSEGALTADELAQFVRFGLRRLRAQGLTRAQILRRVTNGIEATNVKQYDVIGIGASVTKSNIGTAYVDVLPGANGQRSLIDFTGATEFRVILSANLVGSGPFGVQLVRDGDSSVLYEAASIAQTGERELDTDWLLVPQGIDGLTLVRLQAKSTTAADDPVFRRCTVVVR
jgi:hypothetical protein